MESVYTFDDQGPGKTILMRVDEEGVPCLVQCIRYTSDRNAFVVELVESFPLIIPATSCGAAFLPPTDWAYWRLEEILEFNWQELAKRRAANQNEILSQMSDEPNHKLN
jgi:hypothetical protein